MCRVIFTFIIGATSGYLFYGMKVPGGFMIGSMFGVTVINIIFDVAYMPYNAKILAQIIAGAYIGSTLKRNEIYRMKYIYKPALVMLALFLMLNFILGIIIMKISQIDLLTALMCAIPGGINDIPLIALDMGADTSKVVLLQFVRMIVGIGVFPGMILLLDKRLQKKVFPAGFVKIKDEIENKTVKKKKRDEEDDIKKSLGSFALTFIIASVCGIIGRFLSIPSCTLLFSMLGVMAFKLLSDFVYIPICVKQFAQIMSGAYIGCTMDYKSLLELRYFIMPSIVLLTGYVINSIITGVILHKFFGLSFKEGMLASTPAGVSDMALISSDIGVYNPDVIIMHVIRAIVVVSIFPQIINLIVMS